jgi:CRP/FNR family cyclic AMP-dependent transcriptional regulator
MDNQVAKKLESFFSTFRKQHYKKGEILIRADDDPSGIFYLVDGVVKVYAISKKGDDLVLNMYKPVSFFPMTWAINNSPNKYYYEAVTDVAVWKAPKDEVVSFIKDNPDVLFDLMSRVYRGIEGMFLRMTYLMSGSAYSRLITELLIQAKRFGKIEGATVSLKMSEKDLAASSGMTRETVSREMKVLKDKKLVLFEKNTITVNDIAALEEELAIEV